MTDSREPLVLPALRAEMGDWIYYISFMTMSSIAARISVVDDIHTSKSLKEWLQRMLTDNANKIADYLLRQDQRLFNALVVGTYGGKPNWHEISVKGNGRFVDVPEHATGAMGFLELRGNETLFAIDGQHRVMGIKKALENGGELADEKVCTIFVKGVTAGNREKDPTGFQRTRRLFSTLNRYAKPVQKRDIIALDEDDVVAIVTRRLLEEHPLLIDKVDMGASKAMKPGDDANLTTILAVYDVMDSVLCDRRRGWTEYKRWRPPESDVESFYRHACKFWDRLCRQFPPLKELRGSAPRDKVARQYRSARGGHLIFRPIGLLLVARVVADLRAVMDTSEVEAVRAIGRMPTELSEAPWVGLLWDDINRRMLTAKENQKVARRLLFNALGGDLTRYPYKTTIEALRAEYAGILKRDVKTVCLPRYRAR